MTAWNNRSLDDIEQKMPRMKYVADCLSEGEISALSHLDGLWPQEMSFPEKVLRFVHDRSFYYCRMIALQDQAQSDAVERVNTLRDLFGFYAHQVLGGNTSKVVVDLEQQKLDVANLYSLSHSFLTHAKSLSGEEGAGSAMLVEAGQTVDRQYDRYVAVNKDAQDEALMTLKGASEYKPLQSEQELVQASDRLELVTMRCGNNDVALAGANLDLFALLAQEFYFWQKNLAENSSIVFGGAIRPVEDLEHQDGLLKAALERVSIYATRGRQLLGLTEMLAEAGLELQDEVRLSTAILNNSGSLYSPR